MAEVQKARLLRSSGESRLHVALAMAMTMTVALAMAMAAAAASKAASPGSLGILPFGSFLRTRAGATTVRSGVETRVGEGGQSPASAARADVPWTQKRDSTQARAAPSKAPDAAARKVGDAVACARREISRRR